MQQRCPPPNGHRRRVACARERAGEEIDGRVLDFIERALLLQPPSNLHQLEHDRWAAFVMRWQQFTGRVMAKGVEDTSFYNFHRLISLNEVGGEPGRAPGFEPLSEFHAFSETLARNWPHTLNATSTHDTKRSEDVRARISVLSEIPELWSREVRKWSRMTRALRGDGVPDSNEELLVYQTLVGMWPLEPSEEAGVGDRLKAYLEKALREAKTRTSWISPNEEFEKTVMQYAGALLAHEEFMISMRRLQKKVAFHGFLNSLTQTVLKLTSPGVPDFYQGSELWDFSLVDPDNRRPVDYEHRRKMLTSVRGATPAHLLANWMDGGVKLFTIVKVLEARRRQLEVFRDGTYEPLTATGFVNGSDASRNVVAFSRSSQALVVVPRLTTKLVKAPALPLGEVWSEAVLPIDGTWTNVITGERVIASDGALQLRDVFASFPVAVLELNQ